VIRGRRDWSPLAPTPSFRARDPIFYSESRVGFGGKAHGPGDQLPVPPCSGLLLGCRREAGKEEMALAYHAWRCISHPLSLVVAAFPFF
jgi:hypothetical protein